MLKSIQEWTFVLTIIGIIAILGNWVGYHVMPLTAAPGMIIIILVCVAGLVIQKVLPLNLPAIVYISVIGMVLSLPVTPGSGYLIKWTEEVNLLALTTPILAYAGIAVGRSWADFAKLGWRSIVVGTCVLLGTFLGSAIIAEIVLRIQGVI
ncbi:hypothetical protein NSA56_14175 [Oceanobacillus caeni]|uniref:Membrane protein n=2 Tax=Oceanobacillus caeni TaxID=405946 RepID=A0ABR5MH70_9BACI|nr:MULTISPECIES: hypothetical protein [Bacillaceae]KKE79981.1 membrane protein [Bacilli bacterium VT-13-104]PZD84170.1 hypothetical protein DEJ64_12660 [Bacilli bacterium]KPH72629.1 membrane protein [Oceanobacillus caeni]MCR1835513.1 hypothetical protein [Oceanobacillus caeni]MED4474139.1 hypothetical protein [Oceanobacillus caeni]